MSRWGNCDFSELKKFAEKMDKLEKGADELSVGKVIILQKSKKAHIFLS